MRAYDVFDLDLLFGMRIFHNEPIRFEDVGELFRINDSVYFLRHFGKRNEFIYFDNLKNTGYDLELNCRVRFKRCVPYAYVITRNTSKFERVLEEESRVLIMRHHLEGRGSLLD